MSLKEPPTSHESRFDVGTENIRVDLWDPLPPNKAAAIVAAFYYSTWGDLTRSSDWSMIDDDQAPIGIENAWKIAQRSMSGEVLPNTLESIALTFGISNISRATTHQLVRSRVGAVFGQQGGRDNNWSDFNMRIPESLREAGFTGVIQDLTSRQNRVYQEAVYAGVPYQDARFVLPMGLETNLVASYNMLSFKGTVERRLCNRMMWEINWVARLMVDHVVKAFPWVGKSLRSGCEKRGTCQSVSPMFPNLCVTNTSGDTEVTKDNKVLIEMMEKTGIDWPRTASGTWKFMDLDWIRLDAERKDPDVVMSLTTPDLVLARREEGEWLRVQ